MLWVLFTLLAAVVFLWRRHRSTSTSATASTSTGLNESNWEKDKVYLVQIPCAPKARTASPFALKLETWLRMTKIPYEPRYSMKLSSKGQSPYIEINGEQVADSNFIIKFLRGKFRIQPEEDVYSKEVLATAHAVQVMLETNTFLFGFYWRFGLHYAEFTRRVTDGYVRVSFWTKLFMSFFFPRMIRVRAYIHGLSRHSPEETNELCFADLRAISALLGDHAFLLGDTPSAIDCTLFGHLAQFLYLPLDFPQKAFLREECANVVRYVDRMRAAFWPDWDRMCRPECMRGKLGLQVANVQILA